MTKKATASAIKRLLPREQMVALSDLVPADYNPRDITEEALSGLRESIKRWGLVQNIVWNRRTGNIVGGHQRRKALTAILAELADAGEVKVPCKVVDIDEDEEVALNLSLNNPEIQGHWTASAVALLEGVKPALGDDVWGDLRMTSLLDHVQEVAPIGPPAADTEGEDTESRPPDWKRTPGGSFELLTGDCCALMAEMEPNSVDAVVCDPPYELGFMGKGWDASGIANSVEMWAAVLRVLKPGGHLLAFGGTRTSHRMVCAVEDAGFEVRDSIVWMYGTGFPKSLNLGDGFGTALKPAHEPICLARKPISEKNIAANDERWGTGGINVDGCRIGTAGGPASGGSPNRLNQVYGDGMGGLEILDAEKGRWPANVTLDEPAAALLDEHSGESVSSSRDVPRAFGNMEQRSSFRMPDEGTVVGYGDSGGASRFFYTAKASRAEREAGLDDARNVHPTVKPVDLMRWLVRLVTPPSGTVLDPFTGSGSTGIAAVLDGLAFLGIEQSKDYVDIASARIQYALDCDEEEHNTNG